MLTWLIRGVPSGAAATRRRSSQIAHSTPSRPPAAEIMRAVDQQLPHEAQPSAAERGADRELVLARRTARHEQARDVDAGNQQQATDGAEEREQRRADGRHEPIGQPLPSRRRCRCWSRDIHVSSWAAIVVSSRLASSTVTPGLRRPTAANPL